MNRTDVTRQPTMKKWGPTLAISEETHAAKYRSFGESFEESQIRFANALTDNEEEFRVLRDILLPQRFMGGGRTQASIGSPREVTPFNCFVSETVEDSFDSIMSRAADAGKTMRVGGGIGYDFSSLRPRGDRIVSLDSQSSGPISFMDIFNAVCNTVAGAGHRRGAQMGVLRVDHPDIEEFVRAKQNENRLRAFNISVGITDAFMEAVKNETTFDLVFQGRVYKTILAKNLWEDIMRSTWDWAEPGVIFLDQINRMNNLYYCETLAATNPCGEQPLPPGGACLLGSYNLTKYIEPGRKGWKFNYKLFTEDIPVITRAMDKIHDSAIFPLPIQAEESASKRRMGLGLTGVANAGEALGHPYGSTEFLCWYTKILKIYRDETYMASSLLAKEKGSFPAFDKELFLKGDFIRTLPKKVRDSIETNGLRNSHLLSLAPTGTISLAADNPSAGIEPVFAWEFDRILQTPEGPRMETVQDYGYRVFGVAGKKATECTAKEHLDVLALSSAYIDSAVSKTINVDPSMPWEEFKGIYMEAWESGCKGVTTFNPEGKRMGILTDTFKEEEVEEAQACYIDPNTGQKECS